MLLVWLTLTSIYLCFLGEGKWNAFVTELNEILLKNMPNRWIKQEHVQGFYCESITFKADVNMFECMEIE